MRARLAAVLATSLSIASGALARAEPADCGVRRRLAGIDVSSYQGPIDWKQVKRAGVVFAFARVSDGVDVVDARFADNFRAMKRAGVRRGAYQHFRAGADPDDQADLLIEAVRRIGRADLPPVADVETDDGMTPEEVRDRLARWIRRIERRTGRRPIVYTPPAMSEILGGQFSAYHLWVAHYEVDCPTVPTGWQRWKFWQHSSSGQVTGVTGNVDLDLFAGTLTELRRLNRAARAARPSGLAEK